MTFHHAISWFEIPTSDISRAQAFYETIFGIRMSVLDLPNIKMRMFPKEDYSGIGGSLVQTNGFHKPSPTDGPLIYLNANPDVQHVLDKVVDAGGKILVPKTQVSPDFGHMAVIIDTEGNRIALHSIPEPSAA